MTTTREFLERFFATKPNDAYIEMLAVTGEGEERALHGNDFVTSIDEALEFADKHRDSANVFFSICPRVRQRGSLQDIQSVPALWVDIDSEGDTLIEFPEGIPEATFTVSTGTPGHYHFYWVLKEPAPPTPLVRGIVAGLHLVLGADATHDLSRRLRLPGTFNHKRKPLRKCAITYDNPDNVYDLKVFEHLAVAIQGKELVKVGEPEAVDIDAVDLTPYVRSLITDGKESRFASRFTRADGTVDRSRLDMAIASALYKAGLSAEQIHGVFANYPCSGRYHEISHRVPYVEHTISAAAASAKESVVTIDFTQARPAQVERPGLDPCPLPDAGWLRTYVEELDVHTEAPASFHLHAALCALSAVIGNKVLMPPDVFARYVNLYAVLVGESGTTGKSTAIAMARDIVFTLVPEYPVYGDFTTEALAKIFFDSPVLFICRDELGALTSASSKKYSADVIPALTELYDGNLTGRLRATVQGSKWKHPAVTALFGSTIAWLRKGLDSEDAIAGGFFPRFLVVLETDTGKAIPRSRNIRQLPRELAKTLYPTLKDFILHDDQIPSSLTPEATKLYDSWYVEQRKKEVNMQESYASFFARLRTSAVKVALLVQLSTNGGVNVSPESMKYAIKLCDWHQRRLFAFLGAVNPLEQLVQKVADVVRTRGVATKTEIYRALPGKRPNEVRDVVLLLVERGIIEQVNLPKTGRPGRPATGFRVATP